MAKEKIVVEGGTPLAGEVHISGAKNSALKLIAAALLGQGESVIHNVSFSFRHCGYVEGHPDPWRQRSPRWPHAAC